MEACETEPSSRFHQPFGWVPSHEGCTYVSNMLQTEQMFGQPPPTTPKLGLLSEPEEAGTVSRCPLIPTAVHFDFCSHSPPLLTCWCRWNVYMGCTPALPASSAPLLPPLPALPLRRPSPDSLSPPPPPPPAGAAASAFAWLAPSRALQASNKAVRMVRPRVLQREASTSQYDWEHGLYQPPVWCAPPTHSAMAAPNVGTHPSVGSARQQ